MPIVDLVTPWAADPERFIRRPHPAMELVRRQRAPTEPFLPAPESFEGLAERVGDPSLHQRLRDTRDRLVDRGLSAPRQLILVASSAPGSAAEPLPARDGGAIALFLGRATDDELVGALTAAMAAITRWTHPNSPVAGIVARGDWDRWAAAREVPLMEWIYSSGLGVHARAMLESGKETSDLLGLSHGEFQRLRRDERQLTERLDADLSGSGVALVMRWLEDDAPPALRKDGEGGVIPRGAGRYLAWRELRERVERVGVVEACGMTV